MPTLSAAQLSTIADGFEASSEAVATYRDTTNDPTVDKGELDGYVSQLSQAGTNIANAAIAANFDDTAAAFTKLQGVLTQANGYITALAAEVTSWNRAANVITAIIGLATSAAGPATGILSAAEGVEKACVGS